MTQFVELETNNLWSFRFTNNVQHSPANNNNVTGSPGHFSELGHFSNVQLTASSIRTPGHFSIVHSNVDTGTRQRRQRQCRYRITSVFSRTMIQQSASSCCLQFPTSSLAPCIGRQLLQDGTRRTPVCNSGCLHSLLSCCVSSKNSSCTVFISIFLV